MAVLLVCCRLLGSGRGRLSFLECSRNGHNKRQLSSLHYARSKRPLLVNREIVFTIKSQQHGEKRGQIDRHQNITFGKSSLFDKSDHNSLREAVELVQTEGSDLEDIEHDGDSEFSSSADDALVSWVSRSGWTRMLSKMDPSEMVKFTIRTGRKMKPKAVQDYIVNMDHSGPQ